MLENARQLSLKAQAEARLVSEIEKVKEQDAETLGKMDSQIEGFENKIKELNSQKHRLFLLLKQVWV